VVMNGLRHSEKESGWGANKNRFGGFKGQPRLRQRNRTSDNLGSVEISSARYCRRRVVRQLTQRAVDMRAVVVSVNGRVDDKERSRNQRQPRADEESAAHKATLAMLVTGQ